MKLLVSMILLVVAVTLTSGSAFAIDRCNENDAYSTGTNSQTGTKTWTCKFDKHLNAGASNSWYYFCSATYDDGNGNPVYNNRMNPSQLGIKGNRFSTDCTVYRSPGGELGTACSNLNIFTGDSFSLYPECGGDSFSGAD